jgi:peptide/nickel transport system substrate-binding protein
MRINRRDLLKSAAAGTALGALPAQAQDAAQDGPIEELVIAYNVHAALLGPDVGPSAVNPTIQGLYQSVFDQFILQQPDLSRAPASSPNGAGTRTAPRSA